MAPRLSSALASSVSGRARARAASWTRRIARGLTLAVALGATACPADGGPEANGPAAPQADGGRAGDGAQHAAVGDETNADAGTGGTPAATGADAPGGADGAGPPGGAARDGAAPPVVDAKAAGADAQVAPPLGEWVYVNATYFERKGDAIVANVSGSLSIKADGAWSHSRYIGQIGAFGAGKYVVRGDVITLKHEDGKSEDLVYKFFVGEHAREGVTMKALTLSFTDDSFVYLLIEKKK